jgi:hypothetical protein
MVMSCSSFVEARMVRGFPSAEPQDPPRAARRERRIEALRGVHECEHRDLPEVVEFLTSSAETAGE